jgi:hypothetical protein
MAYNPNLFGAGATVANASTLYQNGQGSTLVQGAPVSLNGAGQVILTDVTDIASVQAFIGFVGTTIAASAYGSVVSTGRLTNLSGYSFVTGLPVYIGIGGILQQTKPDYGVTSFQAGDSIIFCGVIVNNTANPSNQDLQISIQNFGVL